MSTDIGTATDSGAVQDTDLIGVSRSGVWYKGTGARFVRTDAVGNVGIGTASPSHKLHVAGTNATIIMVESTNTGASDTQLRIKTPDRDWRIGQNIGGTGVGLLGFYDVTASGLRWAMETGGHFRPGADNFYSVGTAAVRVSTFYGATGSINTSDEREKQQFAAIPDEWLDIWGSVAWQQFKFNDAVAAKGDAARWHFGLLAQQIRDQFATIDVDAAAIGLLCYDEWPETPAVAEVPASEDAEGNIIPGIPEVPAIPAGNRWGLRYDECFAIEAAYQRRRMDRIEARLAHLP